MRYRIGENPEEYTPSDQDFSVLAAVTVFMGLGFVIAGIKVRRPWMIIWGTGLVLASLAYLGHMWFGLWR